MYDNIVTIDYLGGKIVVRKGGVDDWAAYRVEEGQSEQSGSLNKVSPSSVTWEAVNALMEVLHPNLTYRH